MAYEQSTCSREPKDQIGHLVPFFRHFNPTQKSTCSARGNVLMATPKRIDRNHDGEAMNSAKSHRLWRWIVEFK
jgi:hypothetical protein